MEEFPEPLKEENLQLSAWADQFLDDIDYERELKKERKPENAENRMRNLRELTRTMDNKGDTHSLQPVG